MLFNLTSRRTGSVLICHKLRWNTFSTFRTNIQFSLRYTNPRNIAPLTIFHEPSYLDSSLNRNGKCQHKFIGSCKYAEFHKGLLFNDFTHNRCYSDVATFLSDKYDNITEDTLVYSYRAGSFDMVSILPYFGIMQYLLILYFCYFLHENLRDTSATSEGKEVSRWKQWNLGNSNFKNGVVVVFAAIAHAMVVFTFMYPSRMIRSITALKGGNDIRLTTPALRRKSRTLTLPLSHTSCVKSRHDAVPIVPMKIKGRWFHYMIDKSGTFHNESLFDYHIALLRNVKAK